jgi:hypothetical protein
MKGWLDEIMHGRMDELLDEWMDGMGEWMNGSVG